MAQGDRRPASGLIVRAAAAPGPILVPSDSSGTEADPSSGSGSLAAQYLLAPTHDGRERRGNRAGSAASDEKKVVVSEAFKEGDKTEERVGEVNQAPPPPPPPPPTQQPPLGTEQRQIIKSVGKTGVKPEDGVMVYAEWGAQRDAAASEAEAEPCEITECLPEGSLLRPAVGERDILKVLFLAEDDVNLRKPYVVREVLIGLEALLGESVQLRKEGLVCEFLANAGVSRLLAIVARHLHESADVAEGFCCVLGQLGQCESILVTRELLAAPVVKTLFDCLEGHPTSKDVVCAGLDAMYCLVRRGEALETALRTEQGLERLRRAMARAGGGFGKEVDVALSALEIVAIFVESSVSSLLQDGTIVAALKCCEALACSAVDEVVMRIVKLVADAEDGRRLLLGMSQEPGSCEILNTLAAIINRSLNPSGRHPLTTRRVCAVVKRVSCVVDTDPELSLAASSAIVDSNIIKTMVDALNSVASISDRKTAIAVASEALDALRQMTWLGDDVCGLLQSAHCTHAVMAAMHAREDSRDITLRGAMLVERLANSCCGETVSSCKETRQFFIARQNSWMHEPMVSQRMCACVVKLEERAAHAASMSVDLSSSRASPWHSKSTLGFTADGSSLATGQASGLNDKDLPAHRKNSPLTAAFTSSSQSPWNPGSPERAADDGGFREAAIKKDLQNWVQLPAERCATAVSAESLTTVDEEKSTRCLESRRGSVAPQHSGGQRTSVSGHDPTPRTSGQGKPTSHEPLPPLPPGPPPEKSISSLAGLNVQGENLSSSPSPRLCPLPSGPHQLFPLPPGPPSDRMPTNIRPSADSRPAESEILIPLPPDSPPTDEQNVEELASNLRSVSLLPPGPPPSRSFDSKALPSQSQRSRSPPPGSPRPRCREVVDLPSHPDGLQLPEHPSVPSAVSSSCENTPSPEDEPRRDSNIAAESGGPGSDSAEVPAVKPSGNSPAEVEGSHSNGKTEPSRLGYHRNEAGSLVPVFLSGPVAVPESEIEIPPRSAPRVPNGVSSAERDGATPVSAPVVQRQPVPKASPFARKLGPEPFEELTESLGVHRRNRAGSPVISPRQKARAKALDALPTLGSVEPLDPALGTDSFAVDPFASPRAEDGSAAVPDLFAAPRPPPPFSGPAGVESTGSVGAEPLVVPSEDTTSSVIWTSSTRRESDPVAIDGVNPSHGTEQPSIERSGTSGTDLDDPFAAPDPFAREGVGKNDTDTDGAVARRQSRVMRMMKKK